MTNLVIVFIIVAFFFGKLHVIKLQSLRFCLAALEKFVAYLTVFLIANELVQI